MRFSKHLILLLVLLLYNNTYGTSISLTSPHTINIGTIKDSDYYFQLVKHYSNNYINEPSKYDYSNTDIFGTDTIILSKSENCVLKTNITIGSYNNHPTLIIEYFKFKLLEKNIELTDSIYIKNIAYQHIICSHLLEQFYSTYYRLTGIHINLEYLLNKEYVSNVFLLTDAKNNIKIGDNFSRIQYKQTQHINKNFFIKHLLSYELFDYIPSLCVVEDYTFVAVDHNNKIVLIYKTAINNCYQLSYQTSNFLNIVTYSGTTLVVFKK